MPIVYLSYANICRSYKLTYFIPISNAAKFHIVGNMSQVRTFVTLGMKMKRISHKWRLEWFLLAALFSAALTGGIALTALKREHERRARIAATEAVLEKGDALMDTLCGPALKGLTVTPSTELWRSFSARVDSAFSVRRDVQSLSVSKNGTTLFQRQSGGLLHDRSASSEAPVSAGSGTTEIEQGALDSGGVKVPVFVLTRRFALPDGELVVEATFKRDAVGAEEKTARKLVSSLFFFSFAVLVIAFSACALVLSVAVIRERRREERERQEEHLAFSGVLANGILHDFRNPMSSVRLDAQMLGREMRREEGFREARVKELSERIARTMERMDKVFTEFLFLAKPSDAEAESVNLVEAVQECLDTLTPRLEQAGLSAVFEPPPTPVFVRAHAAPFRRALTNVLVNATQFANRGSSILVSLETKRGKAVLDVHNEGPSIEPKMREKIFDMFVTGRPEGTGLGLFLARTAIERCGGSIRVADSPSGTTFRITLDLFNNSQTSDEVQQTR